MFTTATNFIARHAFVVMPKAARKPSPPPMQFSYPLPYGANLRDGGVQFSVYSRSATAMRVLLYQRVIDRDPVRVIELDPQSDRWGDIWSVFVPGLKPGAALPFSVRWPVRPRTGHRFNSQARLLDPYARALAGRFMTSEDGVIRPPKCVVVDDSLRLARRPPSTSAAFRNDHLRNARPRLHAQPVERNRAARHVRRHCRKNSVLEIARRDRGRVDAG